MERASGQRPVARLRHCFADLYPDGLEPATAPGTNLNLDDGSLHNWAATAAMDGNTPSLFGFTTNVLAGRPTQVGLAVENLLTAYTDAQDSGPKQAFSASRYFRPRHGAVTGVL